jgi:hypothetical protein
MLNTIVDFKEYLDDIIKKGYKNDIVKLSSIYHMIKEYKEEQETNDQMITFEYNDEIDMKEIDDISEQFMIDMLEDETNDLSITQVVQKPTHEPVIILYKNNKHYQENLGRFLETMDYY